MFGDYVMMRCDDITLQVCVLAALEEVTRQQRSLRRTLDRLVRRENREEVRHLLDMTETEEEDQDQERPGQLGIYVTWK